VKGYRVVNIVAVLDLGREVDLDLLHSALSGSYFAGPGRGSRKLVYRPGGRVCFVFSRSGKVIAAGARGLGELVGSVKGLLAALAGAGLDSTRPRLYVTNMVVSARLGRVDLYRMLESLAEGGARAYLDPDIFPALVVSAGWFSALVFSNGKAVVLGVRSEEEAERALSELRRHARGHGGRQQAA